MAQEADFADTLESISSSLLATTRSAAQLANEDVDFHRSLDPQIGTRLDRQNARLLDLSQRLLGSAIPSSEVVRPTLTNVDSIDEQWRGIVDILDSLLEKADTSLDEFSGAVKRSSREGVSALSSSSPCLIH